jgi:hypothetical protein
LLVVWLVIVIWVSHEYFGEALRLGEGIRRGKSHMVISFGLLTFTDLHIDFLVRHNLRALKAFHWAQDKINAQNFSYLLRSPAQYVVLDRQTNFHEFYISPDSWLGYMCLVFGSTIT